MRDKLIELIKSGTGINHNGKCDICQTADCIGCLADYLMAHGVTVQKWIPVSERLPELRTKVLCCGERGGRFIAELGVSVFGPKNSIYWDRKNGKLCSKVTHWMPLPEAPKEVE